MLTNVFIVLTLINIFVLRTRNARIYRKINIILLKSIIIVPYA